MKKIIYSFLSVLFLAVTLNSCVDDTDYDTPQINCDETIPTGTSAELVDIIANWGLHPDEVKAFSNDDPNYITVYAVSSDETGNFYKEFFVQDKPENPTAAIKISVDLKGLYTKFNPGRKLYIYLKGLAIGKNRSGEIVLSESEDGNLARYIRVNKAKENIIRSCETVALTPIAVDAPSEITDDFFGKFVKINNVQFDLSLLGKTFVDPLDLYDSQRMLTGCADESQIPLESSTFASFKNENLPEGQGSVTGVITRNYGDDYNVLHINSIDAFSFDGERCDPVLLDCGEADADGANVIYEENFDSYSNYTTSFGSWENVNVNGGNTLFKIKSYSGNKFADIGAYNCGENPLETWLISPAINLDSSTEEVLTFKTLAHHDNGVTLKAYVSTDYTGDITTATWQLIDANIGSAPGSTYGSFENSGFINISCLEGDIHIAFRYRGGDGAVTTGMRVDDVKVTGN